MIRNSERNRIKESENDQKDPVNFNNTKQFGSNNSNKSFTTLEPHLKAKITNNSDKSSLLKKTTPLKRGGSATDFKLYPEAKRKAIPRTNRHKEQEREWTPEGFDLNLDLFDAQLHEKSETVIDIEEEFTVPSRSFTITEPKLNIEPKDDYATVEYGPPKEIELPYEPEQSCIIDVSNFTDYADISAYEIMTSIGKDVLEFNSLYDEDVLDSLKNDIFQHDEFEFESEWDSELSINLQDDLQIPFKDHLFDVDYFLQHCDEVQ